MEYALSSWLAIWRFNGMYSLSSTTSLLSSCTGTWRSRSTFRQRRLAHHAGCLQLEGGDCYTVQEGRLEESDCACWRGILRVSAWLSLSSSLCSLLYPPFLSCVLSTHPSFPLLHSIYADLFSLPHPGQNLSNTFHHTGLRPEPTSGARLDDIRHIDCTLATWLHTTN